MSTPFGDVLRLQVVTDRSLVPNRWVHPPRRSDVVSERHPAVSDGDLAVVVAATSSWKLKFCACPEPQGPYCLFWFGWRHPCATKSPKTGVHLHIQRHWNWRSQQVFMGKSAKCKHFCALHKLTFGRTPWIPLGVRATSRPRHAHSRPRNHGSAPREQQPSIRSSSRVPYIHNQDDIPELAAASIVWELVLWEQKIAQQKKNIHSSSSSSPFRHKQRMQWAPKPQRQEQTQERLEVQYQEEARTKFGRRRVNGKVKHRQARMTAIRRDTQ